MPRPRRNVVTASIARPAVAGAALWAAALAYYAARRPSLAAMAAGGAAYAAILAALCARLVRSPAPPDRLRATGRTAPLSAWYAVALAVLAWGFLYGVAFGGVSGGVYVPLLTPWVADLSRRWLAPGVDGTTVLNFASFAVVPGLILAAAGATRPELALAAPVKGTGRAAAACLALPAAFVAWGFAAGKVTAASLGVAVVHDFLSNGFAEEFMCRAVLLAALRSVLPVGWAVVTQGLLFGLVHVGGAIPEEGCGLVAAAAAAVALNAPMGMALGVVAARTGSLALPTAVHVSLHLMNDVLR